MKKNRDKKSDSDSIENLLFSGMVYRIISEPDGLRNSMLDMDLFLDTTESLDVSTKIKKIQSAMKTIERIKDKDGAFSAFEAFIEDSRYRLVIVDREFRHIFHNHKSDTIIDQLFNNDQPRKLISKLTEKIITAKQQTDENVHRLIIIPNAVNENISAYLISNGHGFDGDRDFNILLIPSLESHKFQLHEELATRYSFTIKEKLVLSNLISGCDVQQLSEILCVSLSTIRSHLKSIFRKTDTKSQSDLIRLFLMHELQFLESYIEPVNTTSYVDSQTPNTDLFITLDAGNIICYRDYGPDDGRPLVLFHNLMGSRFHIPYKYSEILHKTNRRIIIPERPGYGLSDVVSNYTKQWHNMFSEFIDKLNVSSFDLLGNVSGSANAVDYAATQPEKLQSVILTSPLFFNHAAQKELLSDLPYNCARMAAVSKRMAKSTFRLWMKSMKFDTERYVRRMIKQYAGHNEIHILDDQEYIDRLVLNFTESQRHNSNGSAQDAVYSLTPLELDLTKITVPFNIWIGDEDSLLSVASAKEICAPLPNKKFHIYQGYGEDIYYHLFEKIIQ